MSTILIINWINEFQFPYKLASQVQSRNQFNAKLIRSFCHLSGQKSIFPPVTVWICYDNDIGGKSFFINDTNLHIQSS